MPDQSFHRNCRKDSRLCEKHPRGCSSGHRPKLVGLSSFSLRRLVTDLTCGCAVSPVMAIASASLVAQEPNAGNGAVNVPPAQLKVTSKDHTAFSRRSLPPRLQRPGYGDTSSHAGQPWPGSQTERLAQNTAAMEVIRPGIPTVQGTQPPSIADRTGVQQPLRAGDRRFDAIHCRLPTLLPPTLGLPMPNEPDE